MRVSHRARVAAALVGVLAGAGCATARQYLALSQVVFAYDRIVNVRLAGVPLDGVRQPSDISAISYGRIAAAALRRDIPLEFDMHVGARNPAENNTTARLTRFQWTLFLNQRETVSGALDTVYTFAPGVPAVVRVPIRLDVARFFQSNAADALDLALGLAGLGTRQTDVELRAVPTIDTPLGPITYPNPIIIRRTVGAATSP